MVEDNKTLEDSLKEIESLAEPLALEFEKISRDAVPLPSMPREAIIQSISSSKRTAKIKFIIKGGTDKDENVPILQPNFRVDDMKLNLKKGNRVLIAYRDGKLGSPVIIGRIP